MHELLPWYANGTLGPAERRSFEEHLSECASCRKELAWVRELQAELEASGPAALADHPSPETLLAAVRPEDADTPLDPDEARDTRGHISVCPTCAEEVGWLSGEAVAADGVERAPSARPWGLGVVVPWLGFAAALVLVAILLPRALRQPDEPAYTGSVPVRIVASTQRAEPPSAIDVPPGARRIDLLFDVDLGPDDLPARLRVERGATEVATVDVQRPDQLFQGLYVVLSCDRDACSDGDFLARLSRAGGGPEVEFRFRLQTGAP